MIVEGLPVRWLAEWTAELRTRDFGPGHAVVGVLLRGSHARDAGTRYSDVDFDVLVAGGPYRAYPAWLTPYQDRLLHVSAAVHDAVGFLEGMDEPARWSYGWPVRAPVRPLWTHDGWQAHLELTDLHHPAGPPELEDLIADLGKVAAAYRDADELGVRSAAADLARLVPTVLRLINPPGTVAHRREALETVLGLPVAPDGYREDMLTCLGFAPAPAAEVFTAVTRLVTGVLPLLRPVASALTAYVGDDLARAVGDGRLDRYVQELLA